MANSKNTKKPAAKKKPAENKQPPKKNASSGSAAKAQRNAIIIMGVAVILFFVAVLKGRGLWEGAHKALYAGFGAIAIAVPIYMIYVAFVYAKHKTLRNSAANLIGIGTILVLLSGALHILFNTEDYLTDVEFGQQLSDLWETAPSMKGGGLLGCALGRLLVIAFGKAPATIIIWVVLAVVVLLVTGISLGQIFSVFKKSARKVGEITNEKLEKNAQRREQIAAEKEEAEKAKKAFAPPAKPTIAVDDDEDFSDQFVTDETTLEQETYKAEPDPVIEFTPEEPETFIPEIPVIKLPDPSENSVVDDVIEIAVEENRMKAPSMPDGNPFEDENGDDDDGIREFPIVEETAPEYVFPPMDCLRLAERDGATDNIAEMQLGAKKLISTLESFKIKAEVTNICRGPSVTRYELVPDAGVRINKITNLADDIALRLAATSVRIEAPIPGKSAIGIEVPNSAKSMVTMRETIDTPQFRDSKSKLNVALGKDITGNIICADLAKMPHLLVAGTTGSGKSVCLNAMIVSILYNASPDEVKLVMIDPKMVEFTNYNGIAHLEVPVVSNPRKAAGALGWAVGEMEKRYSLFAENGIRDIKGFNALCESRPDLKKIPQIVIFIDELAEVGS